jgi:hypothetical protein
MRVLGFVNVERTDMSTIESLIPAAEWRSFFEAFSRRHEGWLASVEVCGVDIGEQIEARSLPLEGISIDPGRGGSGTITIMVGGSPNRHLTHSVVRPVEVRMHRVEEETGLRKTLFIDSLGGSSTIVRFDATVEVIRGH